MAYDRYDRDERSRWSDDRSRERGWDRDRSGRDDRGFFERAGDEVASWFGDEDAERRRREDRVREEREGGYGARSSYNRDYDRGYGRDWNRDRSRTNERSGWDDKFRTSDRGGFSDRDYNPRWQSNYSPDRSFSDHDRDYRPMAGDYGRSGREFSASGGMSRGERGFSDFDRSSRDRSQSEWGRDPYRRTSRAGTSDQSDRSRHEDYDPHYRSWRDRHISELDRDYDDYRRENQSRFENDFTSWRSRREQKRGLLGQIREHMEVVGSDDEHVGTVDKIAGDRIILTRSDPQSGGAHHSLSCSDVDRVEGDKVILDCSANDARDRWRDESRSRALFEREDQGEMGPRNLNRSFEGTYR